MSRWSVDIAVQARVDLPDILDWTARNFGTTQRRQHRAFVRAALARLREGLDIAGSRPADPERSGLRSLRVGRRTRHLLLYEAGTSRRITTLRILHYAIDLPRHLPPDADA